MSLSKWFQTTDTWVQPLSCRNALTSLVRLRLNVGLMAQTKNIEIVLIANILSQMKRKEDLDWIRYFRDWMKSTVSNGGIMVGD